MSKASIDGGHAIERAPGEPPKPRVGDDRLGGSATTHAHAAARREVLLIHGAWHGPWTWEQWLPLLSERGYEPSAIELRGHNADEPSYQGVSLGDYCTQVASEVDRRPVPPIMVGHSLGGLIIQHLMAAYQFPAAVLLAPIPGRYPVRVVLTNALRHPRAVTKASICGDLKPLLETPKLARELLFTPETPADLVRRCHGRLVGAWPPLFRQMVTTAPPTPRPGTPTLVLAPGEDRSFTVKMQRRLAEKLGAELREIAGAGHDLPLDTPWPTAAELCLTWLKAHALHGPTQLAEPGGAAPAILRQSQPS